MDNSWRELRLDTMETRRTGWLVGELPGEGRGVRNLAVCGSPRERRAGLPRSEFGSLTLPMFDSTSE